MYEDILNIYLPLVTGLHSKCLFSSIGSELVSFFVAGVRGVGAALVHTGQVHVVDLSEAAHQSLVLGPRSRGVITGKRCQQLTPLLQLGGRPATFGV